MVSLLCTAATLGSSSKAKQHDEQQHRNGPSAHVLPGFGVCCTAVFCLPQLQCLQHSGM
jgi:hypothetical protein